MSDSHSDFPPCPTLPIPEPSMDYRSLQRHGKLRDSSFYYSCLQYAQALWLQGLSARAILCLDRAMGAELHHTDSILQQYPIPYEALCWILRHNPPGNFIGNPRVHFQHYADRLGEPRKEIRKWRAWACWYLTRLLSPTLPGDPRHAVEEPTAESIYLHLQQWGLPREADLWQQIADTHVNGSATVMNQAKSC
jgi:hypothetical protein